MPLPPLPFLRLAVIPSGFPLRGNHSLSQTPSGSRALGKMMGSHLLSEKKKNIFTVSEVWRCRVKMKKNLKKMTKRKKEKKNKTLVNQWLSNSELVAQLMHKEDSCEWSLRPRTEVQAKDETVKSKK